MKKLFILLLIISVLLLVSCNPFKEYNSNLTVNGIQYSNYTDYTVAHVNSLKSPVILIGKKESLGNFNITVRDSNNVIATYGNMSSFANGIGASREIGDTIR